MYFSKMPSIIKIEKMGEHLVWAAEYKIAQRVRRSKTTGITYISCPFEQKEEAKRMGARWDPDNRMWYVPPSLDVHIFFKKWPVLCRFCNRHLVCDKAKWDMPCEYTNQGTCCPYYGQCENYDNDLWDRKKFILRHIKAQSAHLPASPTLPPTAPTTPLQSQ